MLAGSDGIRGENWLKISNVKPIAIEENKSVNDPCNPILNALRAMPRRILKEIVMNNKGQIAVTIMIENTNSNKKAKKRQVTKR